MIAMYLPSPSFSSIQLGPIPLHLYGLCIMAGIIAAWWLGTRRFVARGGDSNQLDTVLFFAVMSGIIGARIYHVVTDHQLFFGPGRNPWDALKIWQGGLGIWGAIALGAVTTWWLARRRGWDFGSLADVLAPGILIAQAIGRLGNWFNQELFGRPSTLPWALKIDRAHRPAGYEQYATFQPTFAYELLWCLMGAAVLIWAEKKFRLGHGRVFTGYVLWYTTGRFFIESLRIDPAHQASGLRLNQYTAIVVFVAALIVFILLTKFRPGIAEHPFGAPTTGADATSALSWDADSSAGLAVSAEPTDEQDQPTATDDPATADSDPHKPAAGQDSGRG